MVSPPLELGTAPLHPSDPLPPDAEQDVAFTEFQASVVDWPVCIAVGVAVKLAIVATGVVALTVTLIDEGGLAPPGPTHVNVYV